MSLSTCGLVMVVGLVAVVGCAGASEDAPRIRPRGGPGRPGSG